VCGLKQRLGRFLVCQREFVNVLRDLGVEIREVLELRGDVFAHGLDAEREPIQKVHDKLGLIAPVIMGVCHFQKKN